MNNYVHIYDTTLRDGTQREGISLSVADKIRITRLLDEMGVTYIEGGWPGSNPKDVAYFDQVRDLPLQHAKIAAFGSTCRKNCDPADAPSLAPRGRRSLPHHPQPDVHRHVPPLPRRHAGAELGMGAARVSDRHLPPLPAGHPERRSVHDHRIRGVVSRLLSPGATLDLGSEVGPQ